MSGTTTSFFSSSPVADSVRPVMTQAQLLELSRRIIQASTLDLVNTTVTHTARVVTRLANDRVLSSDDGELLQVRIDTTNGSNVFTVISNQLDDDVLLAGLRQCETLLRALPTYVPDTGMKHELIIQDTPVPVRLWHEATIQAMRASRETIVSQILDPICHEQLQGAGFVGLMARAKAVVYKDGDIIFFHDETDCEVNVVARSVPGKSTGWSGQAHRDWAKMNLARVTQHAIDTARLGMNPVAVEPGRRTAILMPAAVAQIVRYFAQQWDAMQADGGQTALSKSPRGGNKLQQRIFDPRFTMSSDPDDPDGGYQPYIVTDGVATPPMTWVANGVLMNMAYNAHYAMTRGKIYAESPFSLRLSGGTTTPEEMIAQCKEGILVNRFSDVELVDDQTCLLTGVTQGGCFLIKDGKMSKPVKNFRFLESPFFFLNRVEALGAPERAAFGYTPRGEREWGWDSNGEEWPRQPMIVPPMMVRDFNFSSLADVI